MTVYQMGSILYGKIQTWTTALVTGFQTSWPIVPAITGRTIKIIAKDTINFHMAIKTNTK
jgi:hypothetical protein